MEVGLKRGHLGENGHGHGELAPGEETFASLVARRDFELEEIVSRGVASPEGFWYDQERCEWVLLAKGTATLRFEEEGEFEMGAGDYVLIPAGKRHRVEMTSEDAVWLALHFRG